jgi:transcriptional regulator with XRE-family HTH domain
MFQEKMPDAIDKADKEELQAAVAILRTLRGWSQADLALATGLGASAVSRYESGAQRPSRQTFDRIAKAVGVRPFLVRGLLTWIRAARACVHGEQFQPTMEEVIETCASEVTETFATLLRQVGADLMGPPVLLAEHRAAMDRQIEVELWNLMETTPAEDWYAVIEQVPEVRQWPLCMALCDKTIELVGKGKASQALELAGVAVRLAELYWTDGHWKLRLEGYARAHFAAVLKAGGKLDAAEETMQRARALWDAGGPGDASPLSEERLVELESYLLEARSKG